MTGAPRTPRTVHLIWLGSPIPHRLELLRDDIDRHDPDVEVRVWTDGDLEWLRNRDLLRGEPLPAAKADIARYEILQRHGGLYLDADFRVHRSLGDVFAAIDGHGLVVARQSRCVFTNAFIGAVPGHPLLTELVEGLPDSVRWTGRMTEPATTGPHYLTERLLAHARAGGRALELPQHAVFPWSTDEEPIPASALPASVVMNHDWSSIRGWSWREVEAGPSAVPVPDRASRRRRTGSRPRTRAAATPLVHRLVAATESLLVARPQVHHDAGRMLAELPPAEAAIERWTARRIIDLLRGSARFVDLHPTSPFPLVTAARMLDRPGSAIAVLDEDRVDLLDATWRDPSLRCSTHLVSSDPDDPDRIVGIESHGSALVAHELSPTVGSIGATIAVDNIGVADLLRSLPRCDLVRIGADRLTPSVAEVLRTSTGIRRVGRLLLAIDPLSVAPGVCEAEGLLTAFEEAGLPIRIGPWLVDGRGRTWREHLRVAARPFMAMVG